MEVLLPSGYRVRGVIPGLAELARRDLLDTTAQQAILRLAASRYVTEADDAVESAWQPAVDVYVAGFPREAQDPGGDEWLPVALTVEDLPNLDQRDRALLQELVLHLRSAEQITAQVEAGSYKTEAGAGERLAEFRDDTGSSPSGDDGEDVEPATVGAAAGGG